MTNEKSRLQYIDISKGIGIILVVLMHIIFSSDKFNDVSYIRNYIYSFHMPLFFIISGYCLFLKGTNHAPERSLKEELLRLCRKFLPCYFVWSMIYIVLQKAAGQPVDVGERIRTTITLRGIAPLWFLIALFLCELLYLVLHKYFAGRDQYYYLFTLVLIALTILCGNYYKTCMEKDGGIFLFGIPVTPFAIVLFRFFACMSMLYIGYLLGKLSQKMRFREATACMTGILLLGITFFAVYMTRNYVNLHLFEIGNPIIFILTSVCGSAAVILISYSIQSLPFFGKGLAGIGRYSLGIMVVHYMPVRLMEYSGKAAFMLTANPYVALLLALVITMGCCGAILYILNKKMYLLK